MIDVLNSRLEPLVDLDSRKKIQCLLAGFVGYGSVVKKAGTIKYSNKCYDELILHQFQTSNDHQRGNEHLRGTPRENWCSCQSR
jgi:hypothetical protein